MIATPEYNHSIPEVPKEHNKLGFKIHKRQLLQRQTSSHNGCLHRNDRNRQSTIPPPTMLRVPQHAPDQQTRSNDQSRRRKNRTKRHTERRESKAASNPQLTKNLITYLENQGIVSHNQAPRPEAAKSQQATNTTSPFTLSIPSAATASHKSP